jgi:hypothetical protein
VHCLREYKMKKKKMNKTKKEKAVAISQIVSLIIEIFAFSFIIGGMTFLAGTKEVSADGFSPEGCCTESVDGSICQDMNRIDEYTCKSRLLGTSCDTVSECQKGCCYNPYSGDCSFNSPKGQCEQNGGNWTNNPTCQIQQCILGCCVLGDNAEQTTYRQCMKLSSDMKLQANFQALDGDGTCDSKIGLSGKGACVWDSGDYSGENECKYVTKQNCQMLGGSFYSEFLCTAKTLNTKCFPARNTTCLPDKDQIYYVDSCGNPANVYDATKYSDENYWTSVIPASESCSDGTESATCGNCDYQTGSICQAYRKGKDTQPTIGNYVCRDLNCLNGRKHGESWCVYDYPFSGDNILPVGSRYYVGSCMDGEIRVEQCADFNQEICVQQELQDKSKSEAKCMVNPWRSCLLANTKPSYGETKSECESNPYCMMFNDYYLERNAWWPANSSVNGSSNVTLLTRSDGQLLAGFNTAIDVKSQGSAGEYGKEINSMIAWCVPKYAPGFVFWKDSGNNATNYGGSYTESKYICNIGNFNCISKKQRGCTLGTGTIPGDCLWSSFYDANCGDWNDKDNWECNIDGVHKTVRTDELPKLLAAYNERCRAIGSCGVNSNIAGEKGVMNQSFKIGRAKSDVHGDIKEASTSAYVLPLEYLDTLPGGIISIKTLDQIQEISSLLGLRARSDASQTPQAETTSLDDVSDSVQTSTESERTAAEQGAMETLGTAGLYTGIGGLLGLLPVITTTTVVATGATSTSWGWAGSTIPWIAGFSSVAAGAGFGAIAGYALGKAIIKNQNWSPGRELEFMELMISAGALVIGGAVAAYMLLAVEGGCAAFPGLGCVVGVIIAIVILIVWYIYESCFGNEYDENEYYILNYQCNPWQAPENGDCSICNNDIRPCSEYRCRALGSNCVYFNGNGEPGWCTENSDWASSTISPWKEGLSEGLKYTNIQDTSFDIASNDGSEVPAYTTVEFGVKTDKQAQCRIDNKHTTSFDSMAVAMNIDSSVGCDAGQCVNQGLYHKVALSPYVPESASGSATLGLKQGENQVYIRCRNYAGSWNKAEFVVKVMVGEGPD